jgi:hypothetical protein
MKKPLVCAIELAARAALVAVELLHPSVQVRMLAPVANLDDILSLEIDRVRGACLVTKDAARKGRTA